jgi:NadR type nicotinamide-nucleotide adenylyltransferase
MIKIIITGPECSGKTSLTKSLATFFKASMVEEYAREYISKLDRKYIKKDLLEIAKIQLKSEKKLKNKKIIFCDTDLLTIKIWSEFKFGECDQEILQNIESRKLENHLYILCKPDIDWVFDPQRENQFDRDNLFVIYKKQLEEYGFNYFVIEKNDRLNKSIKKINNILKI